MNRRVIAGDGKVAALAAATALSRDGQDIRVLVAVPESEDREAVVAQVEQAGAFAVTPSELEAMQQQVADMAIQPVTEHVVTRPRRRSVNPLLMAAAMIGGVGGGSGHTPRDHTTRPASFRGRHDEAQIARARAKRDRKAALRRRSLGGDAT